MAERARKNIHTPYHKEVFYSLHSFISRFEHVSIFFHDRRHRSLLLNLFFQGRGLVQRSSGWAALLLLLLMDDDDVDDYDDSLQKPP